MTDRRMAYESYRKRTEIPRGLDCLADRLVRAVIRVQPKNVRQFAADFFDGLLQQRDDDHGEYPRQRTVSYHHPPTPPLGQDGCHAQDTGSGPTGVKRLLSVAG